MSYTGYWIDDATTIHGPKGYTVRAAIQNAGLTMRNTSSQTPMVTSGGSTTITSTAKRRRCRGFER